MDYVETYQVKHATGEHATVEKYVTFTTFRPLNGPARRLEGSKRFVLNDGREVIPVKDDPGAFRIEGTDEIVR